MAYKVLLDANIIITLALKRKNFEVCERLLELAINGDLQAFTTPAIIHISAYWIAKAYDPATAKGFLSILVRDVTVIDANHNVVVHALSSNIEDVEDALQYHTALNHKLSHILTWDKEFIEHSTPALRICTPEWFLKEVIDR